MPDAAAERTEDGGTGEDERSPGGAWKRLLVLLLFVGGLAAFLLLGGGRWLSLEALRGNRDALLALVERRYLAALAGAMLVYAAATALSVPGGAVLSLAMGLLFGRWVGTGAIVVAATVGATAVFLAARYLVADRARRKMGPRARRIAEGFAEDAFGYLLFLRLVPLFPFWLVNLAPAFTPMRTRTYVAATAIGIVPGAFVLANLGRSLGTIRSTRDLLDAETLLALGLLGLLALVPVAVRRLRRSPHPDPSP